MSRSRTEVYEDLSSRVGESATVLRDACCRHGVKRREDGAQVGSDRGVGARVQASRVV